MNKLKKEVECTHLQMQFKIRCGVAAYFWSHGVPFECRCSDVSVSPGDLTFEKSWIWLAVSSLFPSSAMEVSTGAGVNV